MAWTITRNGTVYTLGNNAAKATMITIIQGIGAVVSGSQINKGSDMVETI